MPGEPNEMTHRHQLVGLCGLLALHFYVFNIVDKKFSKQVWDIYKKVKESWCTAVHSDIDIFVWLLLVASSVSCWGPYLVP